MDSWGLSILMHQIAKKTWHELQFKGEREYLLCKRDPMLFEVLCEHEEEQPAASPEACDGVEPCTILATHTHIHTQMSYYSFSGSRSISGL